MNLRRILAIIALIIGLGLIGFSQYIKAEVAEGKQEIAGAQKSVDQGNSLFSLSPYTKDAGKILTDPAQKKIDEGKADVAHYATLSDQLEIGGIALSLLGLIFLAIPRRTNTR
jgi:hypothetical protein